MKTEEAKADLAAAMELARDKKEWAIYDHLSDLVVALGWAKDFGMEEE